jgi:hypothetical protein
MYHRVHPKHDLPRIQGKNIFSIPQKHMNPNNELDRQRLIKAIENSTILPHHRAAGQGKRGGLWFLVFINQRLEGF